MEGEEDVGFREQLKVQITQHLLYVKNQYSCVCTKAFHVLFQTATRKNEIEKTELLIELQNMIEREDVDDVDIWHLLGGHKGLFYDQYGLGFLKAVDCIVPAELKMLDEPTCGICFDAHVNRAFFPCGHMFCMPCARNIKTTHVFLPVNEVLNGEEEQREENEDLEAGSREKLVQQIEAWLILCPYCRAVVQNQVDVEFHRHFCMSCKESKSNILYPQCKHLVQCEKCAKNHCPKCNEEREQSVKIIHS